MADDQTPNRPHSVVHFGCRLNSFESEHIDHVLAQSGRDDLLVVNSCAVTHETERQVKQKIRALVRQHPDKTVAVVGCAAELDPEAYAAMDGVSLVLGNAEKLLPQSYVTSRTQSIHVGAIQPQSNTSSNTSKTLNLDNFRTNTNRKTRRTRAEVMVQNGCDHACTFCAITLARGDSVSVPPDQVVAHVRQLADAGTPEVVLTGIDISAYGQDFAEQVTLGRLVKIVLSQVSHLPRLRLSSIDCVELDEDLKQALAEESRLMPHLHLSLQSGDDMILKRMKRRHTRQQVIDLCHQLRQARPEIVFGADIMVGFPTETEDMFAQTLDFIQQCGLNFVHVFPYSARKGTAAARIPNQTPVPERKRRAALVRALAARQSAALYQRLIGSRQSVLIETAYSGRTPQFVPVALSARAEDIGSITTLPIIAADQHGVTAAIGEAIGEAIGYESVRDYGVIS